MLCSSGLHALIQEYYLLRWHEGWRRRSSTAGLDATRLSDLRQGRLTTLPRTGFLAAMRCLGIHVLDAGEFANASGNGSSGCRWQANHIGSHEDPLRFRIRLGIDGSRTTCWLVVTFGRGLGISRLQLSALSHVDVGAGQISLIAAGGFRK